jgi:hypothetical protein
VADVYVYADESGNLDYDPAGKGGSTPYFGFGTATFVGDHSSALWRGHELRMRFEQKGIRLPRGFHAKNDAWPTRDEVLEEIARQGPRFDFTLLYKANAYPRVRAAGQLRLYKLAWYLHMTKIATQVAGPHDNLHVIVASLGTKSRAAEVHKALDDVCQQVGRTISLCVWDASTAWGLQLADYGVWAAQRHQTRGNLAQYADWIEPLTQSVYTPWGTG